MTLRELETRLAAWHRARYGDRPVNVPRTLAKALEELGELAVELNAERPRRVAIEAADLVFVLFALVRGVGEELSDAIEAKLCVIEARLTNPAAGR